VQDSLRDDVVREGLFRDLVDKRHGELVGGVQGGSGALRREIIAVLRATRVVSTGVQVVVRVADVLGMGPVETRLEAVIHGVNNIDRAAVIEALTGLSIRGDGVGETRAREAVVRASADQRIELRLAGSGESYVGRH